MLLSRAALLLLVPAALLVARVTGSTCLPDLFTPCSIDSPPTEVVFFDSWLWAFDFPYWVYSPPWIVSNTTMCRQQLQFSGSNTTNTASSICISINVTEQTFSAYFDFNVSSCTNQMLLIREAGETEAILSIPCDATSPQNTQTTIQGGINIDILVQGDYGTEDSVTVERLRVVSTICEELTRDNVQYPQTPVEGTATVSCVDNSSPNGGSLTSASCLADGSWVTSQSCLCDPGFGGSDGMGCTGCAANMYKTNTGNEECLSCPTNSMSTPNRTECECNTGYRRTDGADISSDCSECVNGYFLDGSSMCQPCPDGSSSDNSLSISCTCVTGRATASGSSTTTVDECSGCVDGYFLNGSSMCQPCPDGSSSSDPLSTSCTCDTGRATAGGSNTTTGDECSECEDNYYLDGSSMCQPCPDGSSSDNSLSTSCTCVTGRATASGSSTTTVDECSDCMADHFMMSDSSCVPCPGGSTSPGEDAEACTCQENTANKNGEAETTTDCSGCVDGYYRDGNMCQPCPARSNSSGPLSTSCACETGRITAGGESTTTGDECSDCAEGLSMLALNCVPTVSFVMASMVAQEDEMNSISLNISLPPSEDVTVDLMATGYSGGEITIDPVTFSANGETMKSFTVPSLDDSIALEMNEEITITLMSRDANVGDPFQLTVEDDDVVAVSFQLSTISVNESERALPLTLMISHDIAQELVVMVTVRSSDSPQTQSLRATFSAGGARTATLTVDVDDDVARDVVLTVRIESVEPSDMVEIDRSGNGMTMVTVMDDGLDGLDEEEESGGGLSSGVIIGIIIGAVGLGILVLLITLVLVIICRFQVNRQGFYHTDEDKTVAPSMLRYSASLRSISSQTVMPVDGRSTIKENEFYV